MSKTIYKYRLPRDGASITINDYIVEMLHVGAQDGWPMLWAVVDTERHNMTTEIVAWGTGWPLPDDVYYETDYIGTCEDKAGFIWHYFAETRTSDLTSTTVWDHDIDYGYLTKLSNDQTITISCDGGLSTAIVDYDPTISTACTGTISTNIYSDDYKANLASLIEKLVSDSKTANKNACS